MVHHGELPTPAEHSSEHNFQHQAKPAANEELEPRVNQQHHAEQRLPLPGDHRTEEEVSFNYCHFKEIFLFFLYTHISFLVSFFLALYKY